MERASKVMGVRIVLVDRQQGRKKGDRQRRDLPLGIYFTKFALRKLTTCNATGEQTTASQAEARKRPTHPYRNRQ